jgi:hypothetical protein
MRSCNDVNGNGLMAVIFSLDMYGYKMSEAHTVRELRPHALEHLIYCLQRLASGFAHANERMNELQAQLEHRGCIDRLGGLDSGIRDDAHSRLGA